MERLKRILGMDSKKLKTYFAVVMASQVIYSYVDMKGVLYNPVREALGVNNTQFGLLFSIVGIVQIIGYFFLGWVQDRVNVRNLLSFDIIGYALIVLLMALIPNLPFGALIICFFGFGIFGDAIFWPTIQKSVRGLASDDKQATAFGGMETIRGVISLIINGLAIVIYTALGSTLLGVRGAMIFNSVLMILFVFLLRKWMPKDFLEVKNKTGEKKEPMMSGLIEALKMPVVWCTGISAACIYATSTAMSTYFVPYLQTSYQLSVALAGIFGLVNSSITKIIISSMSGIGADKFFKSSASMMRVFFAINVAALALICIVPKKTLILPVCMILLLSVTICCFFIRGVYYAPIGESGVPVEHSAAAMSIASCIGYSPAFWSFLVFGNLLDRYPDGQGYQYMFVILLVLSAIGIFVSGYNSKLIKKKREEIK